MGDTRLFRANSGVAWQGRNLKFARDRLVIDGPSKVELLPEGFPDLFGWRTVTIRPEDVGRRVAVFVGVEVKTRTGTIRTEQKTFIALAKKFGALCGVARSVKDAEEIMDWRKKKA